MNSYRRRYSSNQHWRTETAERVVIPPAAYRSALVYVGALGRVLRLDEAATQGASTEWFTLSAFEDGDTRQANAFADHERFEFTVIYRSVLVGWLDAVLDYIAASEWGRSVVGCESFTRVLRTELWDDLDRRADDALVDLHRAIDDNEARAFDIAQRNLREAHISANDLCVRWVQDLLTTVSEKEGEDAVLAVMEASYERIWRGRYAKWFTLPAHQRLALSGEGMRAHYGGKGRRGDFVVEETDDSYVMSFDPCGTGGVMRRGDRSRGESVAFITKGGRGTTEAPHSWAFTSLDVPYYCAHCPILMEHLPLRDFGQVLRPVLYDADEFGPTRWVVPKYLASQIGAT